MLRNLGEKSVIVLIRKAPIPGLDTKFCTRKNELPQGKYLRYLMRNETTRQRPFEVFEN